MSGWLVNLTTIDTTSNTRYRYTASGQVAGASNKSEVQFASHAEYKKDPTTTTTTTTTACLLPTYRLPTVCRLLACPLPTYLPVVHLLPAHLPATVHPLPTS